MRNVDEVLSMIKNMLTPTNSDKQPYVWKTGR